MTTLLPSRQEIAQYPPIARLAEQYLPLALRQLSPFPKNHALKGLLAWQQLMARFPEFHGEAEEWLRRGEIGTGARVQGLLGEGIDLSGLKITPARVISRGVFPLVYAAIRQWVEELGSLRDVMEWHRPWVLSGPDYLGHRFSVWLALRAWAEVIKDPLDLAYLSERYAEFASHAFPGFPLDDASWQPPHLAARGAGMAVLDGELNPPRASFSEALAAASSRPGFLGHHLIVLGFALDTPHLNFAERERVYAQVIELCQRNYIDPEDRAEASPCKEDLEVEAWPRYLRNFAWRMSPNVHVLTLSFALARLWDGADAASRRGLLGAMRVICPD